MTVYDVFIPVGDVSQVLVDGAVLAVHGVVGGVGRTKSQEQQEDVFQIHFSGDKHR